MEKVLVTGASGYIALHCITELLKNGYAVKGSLRSMNRENEVREAVKKEISDNNLEFCKLDLMSDEGWDSCASDCDYMIHLASPFISDGLAFFIFVMFSSDIFTPLHYVCF